MISTANRRILLIAALVLALDQASKNLVLQFLGPKEDRIVIDGFFRLVNWGNTGAAWSLFRGRNEVLAWVSAAALAGLLFWRRHFHIQGLLGQISLGLICGGIAGNLVDRINPARHQVIDFLRFYLLTRGDREIGFPAFNVADSAICVGVGLLILVSRLESAAPAPPAPEARTEN
ncbi:MAG: signal peptidase II [Verrucomicrobiota bacterium]|jgi:signal peptidase II